MKPCAESEGGEAVSEVGGKMSEVKGMKPCAGIKQSKRGKTMR